MRAGILPRAPSRRPGARRDPKDVVSIWLVREAVRQLGGCRAVNCKSGKDRTASELAISFTQVWTGLLCSKGLETGVRSVLG